MPSVATHQVGLTRLRVARRLAAGAMRCLDPLLSSARRDLAAAGHSGVLAEHLLQRLGLRMVKLRRGRWCWSSPAHVTAASWPVPPRPHVFWTSPTGSSEGASWRSSWPPTRCWPGCWAARRQGVEGHLELLARLAEDRESLVTGLLDGRDPGALTAIDPAGDPHRGGRSTATLTFATGGGWSTNRDRSTCTATSTSWSAG